MKITQSFRPQFAIAALVLGATLGVVPAFAQGRSVNDGGQVSVPPNAKLDAAPAAAPSEPHYGRNIDDGGMPSEPTAAQIKATQAASKKVASKKPAAPAPQHFGRNVDDGGLTDVQ